MFPTPSKKQLVISFTGLAVVVWTLVVAGSITWNVQYEKKQAMEQAYAEAKANLNKDITLRRWATEHGGVYVPITEKQQPVPWLNHVPGNNVTTTDGQALTLLNPASVLRQMMDRYAKDYGIRGRITGLKYLNPGNAPDAWEKQQLELFTAGKKQEVWEVTDIDGQPHLRYLRAMYMEQGCEKCHAILGYKFGDMRGATGINLPLAPYYQRVESASLNLGLSHFVIWLLGLTGIGLASRLSARSEKRRREAYEMLRLSEARLSSFFDSTPDALLISDAKGRITMANQQVEFLLGYTIAELLGQSIEILVPDRFREHHPALRDMFAASPASRRMGTGTTIKARRKDGSECDVEVSLSRIQTDQGLFFASSLRDISQRRMAEERISQLAFFDQLTGLPNRTLLLDRLKQTQIASSRSGSYGALLFIDLDNFKTLNDTLGHELGDVLLQQVAKRLTLCVREGDTVARFGGDEFVLVLAGLSTVKEDAATGLEAIAEKILAILGRTYQLGKVSHNSTASIGATLFTGQQVAIDDLMKQADLAMYKSKAAGRNAVRFFDPAMESTVMERVAMEDDLRQAIEEKQFLLHYQVQVIRGGHITGAEVLVRWQHPQRGLVSPAEFIPLTEETGLILPLGHWVLETACAQLAAWASQPEMAHLVISVNISARQINQKYFVDEVLTILAHTGANPQRLKLELTESMLISNMEEIITKMSALKAKGVGFSLDDFGTGYSSLSYLKRLPLDQLKIDQSFVRDVLSDPNDAAIAKTIIALAQSLGLGVIAEGVETVAELDFLTNAGCHAYQGYFFSRPLPLEGFEQLAQRGVISV